MNTLFRALRGRLQNSWSAVSADEFLAQQQEKIEKLQGYIDGLSSRVDVTHQAVTASENGTAKPYDVDEAMHLAEQVKSHLTEMGRSLPLRLYRHTILFNKGAEVPEYSLCSFEEIAESLSEAETRLLAADSTEGRVKALRDARSSFAQALANFGSVVDKCEQTLRLPAIHGSDADGQGASAIKVRAHINMRQNYTIETHRSFIARTAQKAGQSPTDPPAFSVLEPEGESA